MPVPAELLCLGILLLLFLIVFAGEQQWEYFYVVLLGIAGLTLFYGGSTAVKEEVTLHYVEEVPCVLEDGKINTLRLTRRNNSGKITRVTKTINWRYRNIVTISYEGAEVYPSSSFATSP